jgi:hypothetical protein
MRPAAAPAAARAPPRGAAAPLARRAQRRAARAAAAGGPAAGGGDPLDIDALAARLSAEAERRRRAGGGAARGGYASDPDAAEPAEPAAPPPPPAPGAPVAAVSPREEAEALRRVGPGGFSPDEFELVQELGRISIQTVEDSGSDSSSDDAAAPPGGLAARLPGARTRSAVAAVVAYAARFYSGMPFQDPVPVLLKEYLPAARAVALNELAALTALVGVPPVEDKWRVASAAPARDPPVVQLLGYFMAAPSARGAEAAGGADLGAAAAASTPSGSADARLGETVWVVSRWDGLAPLSLYPAAQQTSGLGLGALFGGGGGGGGAARARFLRAVARGALHALAFCHAAGVAHGSLGAGSILLSTFDDAAAARLIVKLSDFGFARVVAGAEAAGAAAPAAVGAAAFDDADTPLALARAADLRALAAVYLETVLAALAAGGPEGAPSAEVVTRVLGDVYEWDVDAYAAYVRAEPAWEAAAALLDADGGAGWALVAGMAGGRAGAGALAEGPFCSKGNL